MLLIRVNLVWQNSNDRNSCSDVCSYRINELTLLLFSKKKIKYHVSPNYLQKKHSTVETLKNIIISNSNSYFFVHCSKNKYSFSNVDNNCVSQRHIMPANFSIKSVYISSIFLPTPVLS